MPILTEGDAVLFGWYVWLRGHVSLLCRL